MRSDNELLSRDAIPGQMLTEFPLLLALYDVVRRRHAGEESEPWFITAVISDVLRPYFESLLAKPDGDAELHKVADFVERLASHPDQSVRGLVATEIAYPLLGPGRDALLARARRFVGPATRELLEDQVWLVQQSRPSTLQRFTLRLLNWRKVRIKRVGHDADRQAR